jgi:hypothetical protein
MTVGPGITPGLLTLSPPPQKPCPSPSARGLCALRAITAGGELHPALRTFLPPFLGRRSVFNTDCVSVHCAFLMIAIEFSGAGKRKFLAQGLINPRHDRSNPTS